MSQDICTPLHITEVKVKWNEQTAKFFHETLGVPFEKLPEEAKRILTRNSRTRSTRSAQQPEQRQGE